MEQLVVRGATQHNLREVSCELPRNRLVVITGPSGSGKSSLAFDTIYAEGQRRYVESLSAYARQFLDRLPKPKVESIEGLSPAIAIEQRALGKSPRSTVGTVTEIADYLRLLFARVGVPHCPISGTVLRAYTAQEIVDATLERSDGARIAILAPLLRGKKGSLKQELETLRRDGYVRARIDGRPVDLAEDPVLDRGTAHDLDVVVDRIAIRREVKTRLTDSVELGLRLGNGTILIDALDGSEPMVMSERLVCWEHGITLPPLEPRLFSFNSPHGACPRCDGIGVHSTIDPDRVVPDAKKTLREGAVVAFGRRGSLAMASELALLVDVLGVDADTPWEKLPEEQRRSILYGTDASGGRRRKRGHEGIIPRLHRMLNSDDAEATEAFEGEDGALQAGSAWRFAVREVCSECGGGRLRSEALAIKLGGADIRHLASLPLRRLREFLDDFSRHGGLGPRDRAIALPLLRAVTERLGFLIDVGLDYLSLDRSAQSLSGGEGQRIRLATQIGASLIGVLYVLDEPSIGLHARDNARLLGALRHLVDKGNSVLVVEHDRDAILAADHILDMGPGAGVHGGTIVAQGTVEEILRDPDSVTGPYLSGKKRIPFPKRRASPGDQMLRIVGARANNLRNVTAEIPLGLITAVTGVSGSGKSSLIVDTLLSATRAELYGATAPVGPCERIEGLEHIDKVISIDQAPIGRTPRSNPATYTGVFAQLRDAFAGIPEARARGYKAGRFSFNVKGGRCESCQGDGVLRVEMHFLPDVYVTCDACGGRRYNRETLEVRYKGLSIADALDLTVADAQGVFDSIPKIRQRLHALGEVGLGYVQLGQAATTLSGGEAQRVKLATELARRATGRTLYVLDEPTTGLHFSDIEMLVGTLYRLRDAGNSVLVIEHNLDLVACADWVIDMGPEGGERGGAIVATGTPEGLVGIADSHTARFLAPILGRGSHGSDTAEARRRARYPKSFSTRS